jgi:predicted DNA-binding protein (UPF0251 family)
MSPAKKIEIDLTLRQFVALRAYYVEGMTHSAISRTLGCSRQNAHAMVTTAKDKLIRAYDAGDIDIPVITEGLLRPSSTSVTTRDVRVSASRQDELLDALELHMQRRAFDHEEIRECMSGDSFMQTHLQRNHLDQWELHYLAAKSSRRSVPFNRYKPYNAAQDCAAQGNGCVLGCSGCRR